MNYNKESVEKAIACCSLLPPPGGEVVKEFAQDWLELYAELQNLRDTIAIQGKEINKDKSNGK